MPGMDGLEVQRRLADKGAGTPIVFLTGRATDDEERQAWRGERSSSWASRSARPRCSRPSRA